MWTERWVRWLRSSQGLMATVLASIVGVGVYFSGGAPTDTVIGSGDLSLHGSCPWQPDFRDEQALRLASGVCWTMQWVSPYSTVLALVLGVGGVWARVVRSARVPVVLMFLPVLDLVLTRGLVSLTEVLAEHARESPWRHGVGIYLYLVREQLVRVIEGVLWAGGLLLLWRWAGVRLGMLVR